MFDVEETLQLSEVTGTPNVTPVAVQDELVTTIFVAGQVIVGFTVSFTVTSCVQVEVFPELSVTVHITVVFPNGNETGALLVTVETLQLSPVTGTPKDTPVAVHAELVTTTFVVGQIIVGFTVSLTVTICVQVDVFPEPSVTVHVTIVLPKGYVVET